MTLVLEEGLNQFQLDGLKNIINNKELWKKSQDLVKIFEILKIMGLDRYVQYNPRIIRGLDYYTGMVFEAWDASGEGRAVLGGGHYDNLVGDVGGEPLPGVGFAMGDVMISLLLEKYGCLKTTTESEIDVLVTTFDEVSINQSFKILRELHNNQINAVAYPQVAKLQKQIKYADRMGIKIVIILGPSEMETGTVTIKNLTLSSQITVPHTQLIESIQALIAQQ